MDIRSAVRAAPQLLRRNVVYGASEARRLLGRSNRGAGGQGASDAAAPEARRSASIHDVLMSWEDHGPEGAAPVVLLHGIPTHPRLWRYVIPRLVSEGARCLAFELVGFGGSMEEGLERDISLPRQAEYVRDWMRHLGLERATLVGHDLGGGVVQRLAVHHRQLCDGLVLCDCVAYDNWPVPAVRAARAASGLLKRMPSALLEPVFLGALLNLGHDSDGRRLESAKLHFRHYAQPFGPRAFAHQLQSLDNLYTRELTAQLCEATVPSHVVWGENDPLSIATGRQLAEALGARFTVIPHARHFTPEDHPAAVADAVLEVRARSQP